MVSKHTCITDDGGNPGRVCYACQEEEKPRLALDSYHRLQHISISRDEAKQLLDYFMHTGYIGYELDRDLAAHAFVKKLREFLN